SLEDLWGATTQHVSFLDLRRIPAGGEWLQAPLVSCSLMDYEPFMTADWSKILDAVVFIRKMRPSTLVASRDTQSLMPYNNLVGVGGWAPVLLRLCSRSLELGKIVRERRRDGEARLPAEVTPGSQDIERRQLGVRPLARLDLVAQART